MKNIFWMYLTEELSDLQARFEKIFDVAGFYRDYENVWEWLESSEDEGTYYLNISRSHNWKHGTYEEPIQMRIKNNLLQEINVDEIGLILYNEFRTTISYGVLNVDRWDRKKLKKKIKKAFTKDGVLTYD